MTQWCCLKVYSYVPRLVHGILSQLEISGSLGQALSLDHKSRNLGENSDLSAGWEKMLLKKRSIDGYVSIFEKHFLPRCAKYGFSVSCV
jgi:hypothetical protein